MLRSERVVLRAMERADVQRLHELERNVELVVLTDGGWEPQSLAAAEKYFEKHLDDTERAEFVIEVDGKVIGGCGLHHQRRRHGTAELGIGIYDPDYLGQGYGREAIQLLLDWAFRIEGWRRIFLMVFASNERAIRSYRACGFCEEGRMAQHWFFDGHYEDAVVMGLLRSDWQAARA